MSGRSKEWTLSCKVYVGELGNNANKQELEDAFGQYGRLKNVWIARNPPGFAFVEFEDARDAEDACKELHGKRLCRSKVRVEMSHGKSRWGKGGPPVRQYGGGGSRGGRDSRDSYWRPGTSRGRSRSRSRSPPPRRRYSRSRSRSRSNSPYRR
ncbi:serine/arginine-rich splicing factor 3-like [Ylistrum balloti]|uniref:serine/arginine-rich splicing factor 3-like n=1 Tax=Ylistrum balloti TaxID=509963 RepID=UPI002905BEAF|nr:serine/arginine-rich splicing factor 3-like [Ylistrum balloti]